MNGAKKYDGFKSAEGRAWGTAFVMFRTPSSEATHQFPESIERKVVTLKGPWNIAFQPGRGAPASITMQELSDWSQNADQGVK